MSKNKSWQGILLRKMRKEQNKGQKEICYGICVPSYLCKIELGQVEPDEEILRQLYERLGIHYTCRNVQTEKVKKLIEQYYDQLNYALETTAYYELKAMKDELEYSSLALDWQLIQGLEEKKPMPELEIYYDAMEHRQKWSYLMLTTEEGPAIRLEKYQKAYEMKNKSFILIDIMECYFEMGEYYKLNQLAQKCMQLAMEEGNTFRMAQCCNLQGSAWACVNNDEMMLFYYDRVIKFLQNTAWNNFNHIYYNMGAVYLGKKEYEKAMMYLNQCEEEEFLLNHKKALIHIRQNQILLAGPYLDKMLLFKSSVLEELMYQEAKMECEEGFLESEVYLELLEALVKEIRVNSHFGFLFFYKDILIEAYKQQRKYKKALDIECEISESIQKSLIK